MQFETENKVQNYGFRVVILGTGRAPGLKIPAEYQELPETFLKDELDFSITS